MKYINGVEFNDQNRGVFNYASVGALNDMTRNGDVTNFNAPGSFTFGRLGGTENINMRASAYTPGGKLSLSYTNRNYYLRGMFTYSTGMNDKGWAFTSSLGGRYSHEGAIDGTFYKNFSLAFSAEKQWQGGRHSLSMVAFISPTSSLGGRYSHEGAIDGTFYKNFSLAFSAEKQWQGGRHSLSMVAFISPVQRGQYRRYVL